MLEDWLLTTADSLSLSRSLAGVTILLSLTVFLNMVAETMPATSDAVPLLGERGYLKCDPRVGLANSGRGNYLRKNL